MKGTLLLFVLAIWISNTGILSISTHILESKSIGEKNCIMGFTTPFLAVDNRTFFDGNGNGCFKFNITKEGLYSIEIMMKDRTGGWIASEIGENKPTFKFDGSNPFSFLNNFYARERTYIVCLDEFGWVHPYNITVRPILSEIVSVNGPDIDVTADRLYYNFNSTVKKEVLFSITPESALSDLAILVVGVDMQFVPTGVIYFGLKYREENTLPSSQDNSIL